MEQELRRMFEMKETEMTVPPTLSPELRSRIGRQRMIMGTLVAAAALALVVGGFAGARSLSSDDAAPVPPAEERKQEIEPMRNGRIIQADRGFWRDVTAAPPLPGADRAYAWNAFDQDTGSFLYYPHEGRVWVVGEDGLIAEIDCPASSDCGHYEMDTFGPDPDEITVPSADGQSAHVIGFDGTLRDTLDISAASMSPGQSLVDLAWSPDGNSLAVSTEPGVAQRGCDRSGGACAGRLWIFDRDSSEPQLVYTERATKYTMLRDLAWSPDGDTLALLVGTSGFCGGREQAWPRLVTLRVAPGEPVRAETLNVFDDYRHEKTCLVSGNFYFAFPFAWSPDGTRIAVTRGTVTRGGGITEISAENGEVLARHPGEGPDPDGPLAWLPER